MTDIARAAAAAGIPPGQTFTMVEGQAVAGVPDFEGDVTHTTHHSGCGCEVAALKADRDAERAHADMLAQTLREVEFANIEWYEGTGERYECPLCMNADKHGSECIVGAALAAHDTRRKP